LGRKCIKNLKEYREEYQIMAKENNKIDLIEIPYWDFNNIDNILQNLLIK